MMLKVVIVALAFLVLLEQASGQGVININLNVRGEKFKKSQDAAITELLKQGGLTIDTAPLENLDITSLHQGMLNNLLLGQIKELQNQVKNLTLDLCCTKQTCCNKTLTCPSGYERFCEKPDMCYKFSTDEKNYPDARSDCKADGGYLAMPKDPATNTFLFKQSKTRYGPSTGNVIGVWIGLSDEVTEGTWAWEDGTPLGWSNWYPGRSDLSIAAQNCASWLHQNHTWYDSPCNFALPYICEVKAL